MIFSVLLTVYKRNNIEQQRMYIQIKEVIKPNYIIVFQMKVTFH